MSVHKAVETIGQLAAGFSGTLGVWAHSLTSGETIEWNAQEAFPAASTIKLPILYEVYRRADEGRLRLTETLAVQAEAVVGGSGILKELTPGLRFSVRDLATLMIVLSDNTAANLLIDLVGIDAVNSSMEALGLRGTVLENKLMRAPAGSPPSRSTPADLGRLLLLIAGSSILTATSCEEMLAILRRQHHTDQITRRITDYDGYLEQGLEPMVKVASKSGAIRGTRNDVALVERKNLRYVIALMSRECADRRFYVDNEAAVLLADISGFIDAYFSSAVIGQTNIERGK